jgi:hypothetical protein
VSHISVSVVTNKIRTHPILDIYAIKSQRTIESVMRSSPIGIVMSLFSEVLRKSIVIPASKRS